MSASCWITQCKDCKYAVPDIRKGKLQCRIGPPTLVVNVGASLKEKVKGFWPVVLPEEGCYHGANKDDNS